MKSLNRDWNQVMDQGSSDKVYFGMKDSAILCTMQDLYSYMTEPMNSPTYTCPAANIPYDYPAWNDKFLSPVCRDWFLDQEAAPQHISLSDLYQSEHVTNGHDAFKLASCSPVFKQPASEPLRTASDFYGALCTEIAPSEFMDEYFPNIGDAGFMLFNSDGHLDMIDLETIK